jgi:hypothetical protein
MCPVCLATALLITGSVASTGGLAAIVIKIFGVKKAGNINPAPTASKEDHHG